METKTTTTYDVLTSNARIKEILGGLETILDSSETFDELDAIPLRDKLTYSNGFYVNCTSVFIDIRESSKLPKIHTRPVLGKIYRSYLSECVAIMNSNPNCREVVINGDCVSGIMDTPEKCDIDMAFCTTCKLNSLVNILNWRLKQKGYTPIKCGIGIAYGRALMMKAGYKGSGLNDVIWMGDVVNEASNLCHQGNKGIRRPIQVSNEVFHRLSPYHKNLLSPVGESLVRISQYEGDIIDSNMNNWLTDQMKQVAPRNALASFLHTPSGW